MTHFTRYDDIIEKLNTNQVWDFPGGIHPPENKVLSNHCPIEPLATPKHLYVTVKQHIGVEGNIIVESGQSVLKGQALTSSTNPYAVPVHAPTSGIVSAIEKHPSPHPSGIPELTIKIESDGQEQWAPLTPMMDYQTQDKMAVLGKICDSGISGMGGAGFPSHIKLSANKDAEFLIINGVECEPYITADDRLMREHAWQVRQGIDVLSHLLAPKQVLIAIEDNKPEAIEAMQIACRENPLYRVCIVPTKYPSGGEKQLIQILTNREVPAQGLPIDVGVIMQNVATCYAIADAIFAGKPLIQRVTTVTGHAVNKPANYWTLIGTPIQHILDSCEYQADKQKQAKIIMGGPMMGFTVAQESVPIVKTSNCLLVPTDKELAELNEQACIRCGACADVCPASLLPQQMFWHAKAKELDKAQDYNLFDCIECGACAYVCPSEIPLVHYYRVAKADIRAEREEKQLADKARERFEKRAARLQAEQKAREEKHRKAAEARKQAMASKGNDAKDKIAAALARAKAKKQASAEQPVSDVAQTSPAAPATRTDSVTESQTVTEATVVTEKVESKTTAKSASNNQRVQAAIARAKAKKAATQAQSAHNAESTNNANSVNAAESAQPTQQKSQPLSKADPKDKKSSAVEPDSKNTEPEQSAEQASAEKENSSGSLAPNTQEENATLANPEENKNNTENEAVSSQDKKQARVAAAVAKAKAKRAAQKKEAEEQAAKSAQDNDSTQVEDVAPKAESQLDAKKRRIALAVAKAKAKKLAQKQTEDKS